MVPEERYTNVQNLFYILFEYFEHHKCLVCEKVWVCDSMVSHEVSKGVQKDRKLFVLQTQQLILIF